MNPAQVPAPYHQEAFSDEERSVLRHYFTDLDGPVFALVNLPEVVKGALFARYSRSPKSLRRLFLDEFVDDLDVADQPTEDATVGVRRAEALYDRVFLGFGDDSVAQLGGVHLACEQASNVLTKILEWGRLMAYLEQSTRYIAYDQPLGGQFRYYRDPHVIASPMRDRYIASLDEMFSLYSGLVPQMQEFFARNAPQRPDDTDAAYRQATKARALDAVRGMLPAAAISNVGIYGTAQSYETLLMRMRSHPLPEARSYADLMLTELRKVIPSFLKRVDLDDRGGAISAYWDDNRRGMDALAQRLLGADGDAGDTAEVHLADFDPDAETKTITAMLYPHSTLSEAAVLRRVEAMTDSERTEVALAYIGERDTRRHRPGRALERCYYRFDVLSDYGAFRDLQRHRMLTIDWQPLSTRHGYQRPAAVEAAGHAGAFDNAMAVSSRLHDDLSEHVPECAGYAVALAYKIRYSMQMNAREAMHILELRTGKQGHPSYRRVCQQMHRLIEQQAGHKAIAAAMRFVDHSEGPELGRLQAENRNARQRAS